MKVLEVSDAAKIKGFGNHYVEKLSEINREPLFLQGAWLDTKPANASTYHVPQSKNIYYEELRTCNSTKAAQVKYAGISLIIGRKEKDEVDLSN